MVKATKMLGLDPSSPKHPSAPNSSPSPQNGRQKNFSYLLPPQKPGGFVVQTPQSNGPGLSLSQTQASTPPNGVMSMASYAIALKQEAPSPTAPPKQQASKRKKKAESQLISSLPAPPQFSSSQPFTPHSQHVSTRHTTPSPVLPNGLVPLPPHKDLSSPSKPTTTNQQSSSSLTSIPSSFAPSPPPAPFSVSSTRPLLNGYLSGSQSNEPMPSTEPQATNPVQSGRKRKLDTICLPNGFAIVKPETASSGDQRPLKPELYNCLPPPQTNPTDHNTLQEPIAFPDQQEPSPAPTGGKGNTKTGAGKSKQKAKTAAAAKDPETDDVPPQDGNFRKRTSSTGRKNSSKKAYIPSYIQEGEPCVVCGDNSTGLHYRALTCEGCKGFFRRTIQKNKGELPKFVCKNNNSCVITVETRNNCNACRFRNCQNAKMDHTAVLNDRKREDLKQLISKNRQVRRTMQQYKLSTEMHEAIKRLGKAFKAKNVSAFYRYYTDHLVPIGSEVLPVNGAGVAHVLQFVKSLPGIDKVDPDDLLVLVENHLLDIFLIQIAEIFNSQTSELVFEDHNLGPDILSAEDPDYRLRGYAVVRGYVRDLARQSLAALDSSESGTEGSSKESVPPWNGKDNNLCQTSSSRELQNSQHYETLVRDPHTGESHVKTGLQHGYKNIQQCRDDKQQQDDHVQRKVETSISHEEPALPPSQLKKPDDASDDRRRAKWPKNVSELVDLFDKEVGNTDHLDQIQNDHKVAEKKLYLLAKTNARLVAPDGIILGCLSGIRFYNTDNITLKDPAAVQQNAGAISDALVRYLLSSRPPAVRLQTVLDCLCALEELKLYHGDFVARVSKLYRIPTREDLDAVVVPELPAESSAPASWADSEEQFSAPPSNSTCSESTGSPTPSSTGGPVEMEDDFRPVASAYLQNGLVNPVAKLETCDVVRSRVEHILTKPTPELAPKSLTPFKVVPSHTNLPTTETDEAKIDSSGQFIAQMSQSLFHSGVSLEQSPGTVRGQAAAKGPKKPPTGNEVEVMVIPSDVLRSSNNFIVTNSVAMPTFAAPSHATVPYNSFREQDGAMVTPFKQDATPMPFSFSDYETRPFTSADRPSVTVSTIQSVVPPGVRSLVASRLQSTTPPLAPPPLSGSLHRAFDRAYLDPDSRESYSRNGKTLSHEYPSSYSSFGRGNGLRVQETVSSQQRKMSSPPEPIANVPSSSTLNYPLRQQAQQSPSASHLGHTPDAEPLNLSLEKSNIERELERVKQQADMLEEKLRSLKARQSQSNRVDYADTSPTFHIAQDEQRGRSSSFGGTTSAVSLSVQDPRAFSPRFRYQAHERPDCNRLYTPLVSQGISASGVLPRRYEWANSYPTGSYKEPEATSHSKAVHHLVDSHNGRHRFSLRDPEELTRRTHLEMISPSSDYPPEVRVSGSRPTATSLSSQSHSAAQVQNQPMDTTQPDMYQAHAHNIHDHSRLQFGSAGHGYYKGSPYRDQAEVTGTQYARYTSPPEGLYQQRSVVSRRNLLESSTVAELLKRDPSDMPTPPGLKRSPRVETRHPQSYHSHPCTEAKDISPRHYLPASIPGDRDEPVAIYHRGRSGETTSPHVVSRNDDGFPLNHFQTTSVSHNLYQSTLGQQITDAPHNIQFYPTPVHLGSPSTSQALEKSYSSTHLFNAPSRGNSDQRAFLAVSPTITDPVTHPTLPPVSSAHSSPVKGSRSKPAQNTGSGASTPDKPLTDQPAPGVPYPNGSVGAKKSLKKRWLELHSNQESSSPIPSSSVTPASQSTPAQSRATAVSATTHAQTAQSSRPRQVSAPKLTSAGTRGRRYKQ